MPASHDFLKRAAVIFGCCWLVYTTASAQQRQKSFSIRDSLDHAIDLSDWIINANGFVPVPIIITEPALGGFGGGIAPVFLHKNPPLVQDGKATPVPPNVTAAAAGYTVNGSWLLGAARSAYIRKWGVRYKVAAGYGDMNISFYHTFANKEEKEFKFNGKGVPLYLYAAKQLRNAKWQLGIQYLFAHTDLKLVNADSLPSFISKKEAKSNIGELGAVALFDTRDNVFTPDRGIKAQALVNFSDNIFGGDFDYQRLNSYIYWYAPLSRPNAAGKGWISGLRFDYQQLFGNPPFYVKPSVDLRGIPAARYQGKKNILLETEQRWDFVRRWSLVAFTGVGKAFDEYSEFSDAKWIYSYGGGFRYLMARKFKLRMGVDVAGGPSGWAYYIIFGSAWAR